MKKMALPDVFDDGFSKKRRNFPPIHHDCLPSCITFIWWCRFSIELKVSKLFALWNRMVKIAVRKGNHSSLDVKTTYIILVYN